MTSFTGSTLSSLGPTTLAVTWAECGLGTVAFALRIYTSSLITKRWKTDFWWCLLTYVSIKHFHSYSATVEIALMQYNRYSP